LRLAATALLGFVLGACLAALLFPPAHQATLLDKVRRQGELQVVTRYGPLTYYEGPFGPMGLEYELAQAFAASLGVRLKVTTASSVPEIFEALRSGRVQFAAAHLGITEDGRRMARFTPPYRRIALKLVYRMGERRPRGPAELAGKSLEVPPLTSYEAALRALRRGVPGISWNRNVGAFPDDVLQLVSEGLVDCTVADTDELSFARQIYPELASAFDLGTQQQLAWAFPKDADASLYAAAKTFLRRAQGNGSLDRLVRYYQAYLGSIPYVGKQKFRLHVLQRLPALRPLLERAALDVGLDWRLLAAVAYQESHWDPRAVSPAGARGLMMLSGGTAKDLGVRNRHAPEENVPGGAQYLKLMKSMVPDGVAEPDRTWMALAAYNMGYGHLDDARRLTKMQRGDPDRWVDVKQRLPLLMQRTWYSKLRYGYAQGSQAQRYVERIRGYYDMLSHLVEPHAQAAPIPPALRILPGAL
jgi:membrane-bound lytic murein transglycosylase F